MKLLSVPGVQLASLSVLYSQVLLASSPLIVTLPFLVTLSVADVPVSVVRVKLGAIGGVTSMVMSVLFWLGVLLLPAMSVCLTLTVPAV